MFTGYLKSHRVFVQNSLQIMVVLHFKSLCCVVDCQKPIIKPSVNIFTNFLLEVEFHNNSKDVFDFTERSKVVKERSDDTNGYHPLIRISEVFKTNFLSMIEYHIYSRWVSAKNVDDFEQEVRLS